MKWNSLTTSARLASVLVIIGLGMSSHTVAARDLYAGIGIGQSKIDGVKCDPEIMAAFFDLSCNADDTDTAFRLFGGYKIPTTSTFSAAIEIGYIDFGEVSILGTDSFFGTTRVSGSVTGFGISGVGIAEITDRLSLMGKVGMLRWDVDYKLSSSEEGSLSESESGTDFTFGVGAVLSLTDRVSARIEWERFEIDDDDADLLSASILFTF